MITVSYDDSNGVIRTVTYGPTSRDEIEDYLHRLFAAMERSYAEWGRMLHLVDASGLDIQSDENLGSLAGASIDMQQSDKDRTAVVMHSGKAITQLERMPSQMGTKIFSDFKSAKEWLLAVCGEPDTIAA
ncbi:hypothetical protein [Novosphingobium beihaiensis]|uniref:STAS/SEC14 domain-containing protein n=1 Tax=Novosphingobium beihaiensis TaxID=2930389 RepID=A0ABT0BQI5_9SPHN|nr:hypothetical protein [Novosphingobium beihaiensis]MCJ2187325.1 hypothetical protein [Novosphingobium beihaiensis]